MTSTRLIFPTQMPSSEGSLANRFLKLASAKHKTTPDGCGPSSSESFAMFDPATSSWRTSQGSLLPEWETFSGTWPRSGMTRNGRAFPLPRLVPPISGGESSSWPTPTAGDSKSSGSRNTENSKAHAGISLTDAVRGDGGTGRTWPTPTARLSDQRGAQAKRFTDPKRSYDLDDAVAAAGTIGQLNPTWVEWLMGFPEGWTDLEA